MSTNPDFETAANRDYTDLFQASETLNNFHFNASHATKTWKENSRYLRGCNVLKLQKALGVFLPVFVASVLEKAVMFLFLIF